MIKKLIKKSLIIQKKKVKNKKTIVVVFCYNVQENQTYVIKEIKKLNLNYKFDRSYF